MKNVKLTRLFIASRRTATLIVIALVTGITSLTTAWLWMIDGLGAKAANEHSAQARRLRRLAIPECAPWSCLCG